MGDKPSYEGLEQRARQLEKEVAERKHAGEDLRASEEKWRSLVKNAPSPIITVDRKGIIQYINHTVPGLEIEKVIGTNHCDYVPPEYHKVMRESIEHVFKTGQNTGYEIAGVGPDGNTSWYTTKLGPIRRDGQVVGVTIMPMDITERKQAEEALRERETALEIQAEELQEVNTALRVLLRQRDKDKTELEEKVFLNVRELVMPQVEKLKKTISDARQKAYLSVLESNLNEIISPFAHRLSSKYSTLTPTEIQMAFLIRDGKTTKEIAELLNLSGRTIESHRQSIRMKMGIRNRRANLRSHLLSM